MDTPEVSPRLPKIAIAAVVVAFFSAALALPGAAVRASYLLGAIPAIAAGITILRRRAWGGYGFALVALTQVILMQVLLVSGSSAPGRRSWPATVFGTVLGLVFFFAGRALSQAGAKAGARWPWIGLALVFSVPFLFVRAYVMPSGSMENTLLVGDYILVRVFPRPTPKRGDLLVFRYPVDRKEVLTKRVIGVGGDRIRMKDSVVYRDGAALTEPYAIRQFPADVHRDNLPSDLGDPALESVPGLRAAKAEMMQHHVVNGEVIVPPGKYFVLGDNRDNSLDRRYWGFVDESEVIGEPFLIYDSEAGSTSEVGPSLGKETHTRWDRVLKRL